MAFTLTKKVYAESFIKARILIRIPSDPDPQHCLYVRFSEDCETGKYLLYETKLFDYQRNETKLYEILRNKTKLAEM
jgi:hypothetical protein